ncbi:MAG: phosphoenolpyruvate carboxykinase [Streptosporangiaceae bacterium]
MFGSPGGLAASLIIGTPYLPDPSAKWKAATHAARWLSAEATDRAEAYRERRRSGVLTAPWRFYDAISGLAGIGRVLLAAVTAGNHECEQGLLAALETLITMIRTSQGTRPGWWLPAAEHPPGDVHPSGVATTGLAHGIAGPLAFLAVAHVAGWSVPGQVAAIDCVARWLLHWSTDGGTDAGAVPDQPGLLTGAAGIALALADHGSLPAPQVPARWDATLLLSLTRPRVCFSGASGNALYVAGVSARRHRCGRRLPSERRKVHSRHPTPRTIRGSVAPGEGAIVAYEAQARSVESDPTSERLRELTERMPNSQVTEFGNVNVKTAVHARSTRSTFIVDDSSNADGKTITRQEYDRVARLQDEYLKGRDVVVVDGYIGSDPEFRTRARLVIESSNANIAGMQQQLYYPLAAGDDSESVTTVVYTPGLPAPGYPDDRLIAVDLNSNTTRVLNSDYFGESKKGGLRMWNNIVYQRGGLALHAGCKVIPVNGDNKTVLIVGLSGTGKTTTTFTTQLGSRPVQDDFVALMPGGEVYTTENGCFAKTFGLDPDDEPAIYDATTKPDAYLENVSVDVRGRVDFHDTSFTKNGRTTWPFKYVEPADPAEVGPAEYLLILNRNENLVPGVARLDRAQAAAYFMLGETTGTSAGGKEEEGKFLRVPGTNPFFPRDMADMGNRFLELLGTHPLEVYVLNTGRIGGGEDVEGSKKVRIPHSSAMVQGIVEDTIKWETDPDFGYEIATSVPGVDDPELLQPRRLYEREGRVEEYEERVERLKRERREYLQSFGGLDEAIVKSIG